MAVLELSCSSSPHLLEAGLGRTQLTQLRLARPIMLTSGVSDWLWNKAVHRKPLTWSYHVVPHKSLENVSFSHLHPEMLQEHTDNFLPLSVQGLSVILKSIVRSGRGGTHLGWTWTKVQRQPLSFQMGVWRQIHTQFLLTRECISSRSTVILSRPYVQLRPCVKLLNEF